MDLPAHPFWDFSVTLYAKPGVAPACLELQERLGLDVNALMFCLWLAASGRGPAARADLDAALARVGEWHAQVVRTLRPLRRRLKYGFDPIDAAQVKALRARIQAIEIAAEHIEQLALAAAPAAAAPARPGLGGEDKLAHAALHVAAYLDRLGAAPAAADGAALGVVLAAAFALPEQAVRAHLDRALA